MLFLIDINQVMLISDADADFDWSLDALRLVQNQLILIDHGTDAAPQGSQILPKKYWLRRFWKGLKKGFDKVRKPPTHPPPYSPISQITIHFYPTVLLKLECFEDYGSFLV